MRTFLLATANEGKLREFNHAFAPLKVRFLSLKDFPAAPQVEETGATYQENARLKARALAVFTGLPAVADDSGIEIDALPGELGVTSARYAAGRPYAEVNAEILRRLEGAQTRACRYVCALAFFDSATGREETATGAVEGVVHDRQEGDQGFGYDPIFFVPEYGKTMAQLPLEIKNRVSHRARAIEQLMALLEGR